MVASNQNIPPQGTPGILDPRNPTLLPNFDRQVASGAGTVDHESPALFLQNNPRVDATATATIGGTITAGDELTIVISNGLLANPYFGALIPSEIGLEYTVQSGDSVDTIAEAFADLVNDNAVLQKLGVRADVAGAVVTIRHSGPAGNFTGLSAPTEGPAKITIGGTALTGDELAAFFTGPDFGDGVLVTYATTTGQTDAQMATAFAAAITANAVLAALGISATASSAVVELTIPADIEPVFVAAWVNTVAPTATIGGTPADLDVLNLTFTCAALPGGSHEVSVTLGASPTVDSAAAALAAAINADPVLIAAGIGASAASAVVTITYPGTIGQLRFSESVTGGSTITLSATPTETATVGTSATETITFSASALSGGSGPVIPYNNFNWHKNGQTMGFWAGQPLFVDYPTLAALVAEGMAIV